MSKVNEVKVPAVREATLLGRRGLLINGALLLGASGCGYLLYPERRGRTGGRIDVPVLIIDLLWFLPGLIPGIICLVVDFSSGCIYGGGGRASTSSPPSGDRSVAATVEVELDGEIVATGRIEPDRSARLSWSREVDEAAVRDRARVVVRAGDGALAKTPVRELL